MPKVSIITPCFNGERFLQRMLASVVRQTLTDWALVVVDDGSTDRSSEIVEAAAAHDARIQLVRQENHGVSHARNTGCARAPASEYLLFLDADDMLDADMLEVMTAYLDAHPAVGLAYCAFRVIDADDRPVSTDASPDTLPARYVPTRFGYRQLADATAETPLESLMSNHAAYPSVCVMRRSTFEQTGRWDTSFQISEDKDLVLQLALVSPVHFVPRKLVGYRRHGENVTASASVYPSLRRLQEKWWGRTDLTPAQQQAVRRAIRFDRRVAFCRHLEGAAHCVRDGSWSHAVLLALHGGKSFLNWSRLAAPHWPLLYGR